MPIWSYLGLRKLSRERLCIQSWFKGWKSFYKFANNADFFYDIVDFFVLSNTAQSSANLVRGCSCSKSGQTLIPGNEARPINPNINPFPLSFFASCFISRAAKTGLSLLRNQTETLAAQVISDVPLLLEIFRWNNSTQKAVFHFNILSNRVIRNLSVNSLKSNPSPFYMMYTLFRTLHPF